MSELVTDSLPTRRAPVFDIAGLTKVYGRDRRVANDSLTFSVPHRDIFGILGDNGAGKTTLVRQMVGLTASTSGDLSFLGIPVRNAEQELTRYVGYMPQSALALNNLTAREAVYYVARFRGLDRRAARDEAGRMLELWGIGPLAKLFVRQLSGGQRRLTQLAVTMAAGPPVLILDEPTNDLDPVNRKRVWDILRSANGAGTTIVFVTHDAVEAEKVVRRVAIMRAGRIVALGHPQYLKRELGGQIRLELVGDPDRPPLSGHHIRYRAAGAGRWLATVRKEEIGAALANLDLRQFHEVRLNSPTLEDLYLHHATA